MSNCKWCEYIKLLAMLALVFFWSTRLAGADYAFNRGFLVESSDMLLDKKIYNRRSVCGIVRQETVDDSQTIRFSLLASSASGVENANGDLGEIQNAGMAVVLHRRTVPDDESTLLIMQQERPVLFQSVSNILQRLDNMNLPHEIRRSFLAVITGLYDVSITGFQNTEGITVQQVSPLEKLLELLLIIRSMLNLSDDAFDELIASVRLLPVRYFLPEVMGFDQFFPLVRFEGLEINEDAQGSQSSTRVTLNLYRNATMTVSEHSEGRFSLNISPFNRNNFQDSFLRNNDARDVSIGRTVSFSDRPRWPQDNFEGRFPSNIVSPSDPRSSLSNGDWFKSGACGFSGL